MIKQTMPCHCCHGTGLEFDSRNVGLEMRALRMLRRKTMKIIARKMKVTESYICELEHGRRNWTRFLIKEYMKALK